MQHLSTSTLSQTKPIELSVSQHRRVEEMFLNLDEVSFRKFRFRERNLAPTDGERTFLRQRLDLLGQWLAPASEVAINAELAALFVAMATGKADSAKETSTLHRIYREDLAELPGFALVKACANFRRGDVGDGKFVPKPGEIRKEAMRIAKPFLEERARVQAVMSAEVPNPPESLEHRRAVAARWRETLRQTVAAAQPLNEAERGMPSPASVALPPVGALPTPGPAPRMSERLQAVYDRKYGPPPAPAEDEFDDRACAL
jgi:hypothetical protein